MATETVQRICDFLALRDTYSPRDVARSLFLLLASEIGLAPVSRSSFVDRLPLKFAVRVETQHLESAIECLQNEGYVLVDGGLISYTHAAVAISKERLHEVNLLEEKVRTDWHARSQEMYGELDVELLWTCLTDFLAAYFKLHGLRTLALLAPSNIEGNVSFQSVLAKAAEKYSLAEEKSVLEKAVRDFFKYAESDAAYANFISGVASGAFCMLASEAPPEVTEALRRALPPLVLYLDTNFLIAAVGLNYEGQQQVARELMGLIERHNLPFRLRFIPRTERELQLQISSAKGGLQRVRWTDALAKAAANEVGINGIQHAYCIKRTKTPVSVEDFFLRFDDVRTLLKDVGQISVDPTGENEPSDRYNVETEFRAFVEEVRPGSRSQDAIAHDGYLLAWIRARQGTGVGVLSRGCVLVSFDSLLARFESQASRRLGVAPCVLQPHQLLELLRPFVPRSEDFDRVFSTAVFSPEFRGVNLPPGGAYSKMISLLSGVDGLAQEQAARLLANRLLVEEVGNAKTQAEAVQRVEIAALEFNRELAMQARALERRLKEAKESGGRLEDNIQQRAEEIAGLEARIGELENAEREARSVTEALKRRESEIVQESASDEKRRTEEERSLREQLDKQKAEIQRQKCGLAVLTGIVTCFGLILLLGWTFREVTFVTIVAAVFLSIGVSGLIGWRNRWDFWIGSIALSGVLLLVDYISDRDKVRNDPQDTPKALQADAENGGR